MIGEFVRGCHMTKEKIWDEDEFGEENKEEEQ